MALDLRLGLFAITMCSVLAIHDWGIDCGSGTAFYCFNMAQNVSVIITEDHLLGQSTLFFKDESILSSGASMCCQWSPWVDSELSCALSTSEASAVIDLAEAVNVADHVGDELICALMPAYDAQPVYFWGLEINNARINLSASLEAASDVGISLLLSDVDFVAPEFEYSIDIQFETPAALAGSINSPWAIAMLSSGFFSPQASFELPTALGVIAIMPSSQIPHNGTLGLTVAPGFVSNPILFAMRQIVRHNPNLDAFPSPETQFYASEYSVEDLSGQLVSYVASSSSRYSSQSQSHLIATVLTTLVDSAGIEAEMANVAHCVRLAADAALMRVYGSLSSSLALVAETPESCDLYTAAGSLQRDDSSLFYSSSAVEDRIVSSYTLPDNSGATKAASELRWAVLTVSGLAALLACVLMLLLGAVSARFRRDLAAFDFLFSDDHPVREGDAPRNRKTLHGAALSVGMIVMVLGICLATVLHGLACRYTTETTVVPSAMAVSFNTTVSLTIITPVTPNMQYRRQDVDLPTAFHEASRVYSETLAAHSDSIFIQRLIGENMQIAEPGTSHQLSFDLDPGVRGVYDVALTLNLGEAQGYSLQVPQAFPHTDDCVPLFIIGFQLVTQLWDYPEAMKGWPETTAELSLTQIHALCDDDVPTVGVRIQQANYAVLHTVIDNLELLPLAATLAGLVGGLLSVVSIAFKNGERLMSRCFRCGAPDSDPPLGKVPNRDISMELETMVYYPNGLSQRRVLDT